MGDKTGIIWTDATWNPLIGCSRVSAGCENCYAEKVAHRFQGTHEHYAGTTKLSSIKGKGPRWTGKVNQAPLSILDQPLRWTRPRMVFVNSMSDLFHETVPFEFIAGIFGIMAAAPQHTFQVLTKRPERAVEFFKWLKGFADDQRDVGAAPSELQACLRAAFDLLGGEQASVDESISTKNRKALDAVWTKDCDGDASWPLPNVWMGTSVENQAAADARVPALLKIPAVIRWISAEPLLGPVDFSNNRPLSPDFVKGMTPGLRKLAEDEVRTAREDLGTQWMGGQCGCGGTHRGDGSPGCPVTPHHHHDDRCKPGLDWMVVGGESGPGARPMAPFWAADILKQCQEAEVPYLFKQWGAWAPHEGSVTVGDLDPVTVALPLAIESVENKPITINPKKAAGGRSRTFQAAGGHWMERVGKKVAGRKLLGQHWDGYPEGAR